MDRNETSQSVDSEMLQTNGVRIRQIEEIEPHQMEEARRESEQTLHYLTDNLPNATVYQLTVEPDGGMRFLYINRAVERLHEVSVEAALADAGVIYGQVLPKYHASVREREEEGVCFIQKPFSLKELAGKVRAALDLECE